MNEKFIINDRWTLNIYLQTCVKLILLCCGTDRVTYLFEMCIKKIA